MRLGFGPSTNTPVQQPVVTIRVLLIASALLTTVVQARPSSGSFVGGAIVQQHLNHVEQGALLHNGPGRIIGYTSWEAPKRDRVRGSRTNDDDDDEEDQDNDVHDDGATSGAAKALQPLYTHMSDEQIRNVSRSSWNLLKQMQEKKPGNTKIVGVLEPDSVRKQHWKNRHSGPRHKGKLHPPLKPALDLPELVMRQLETQPTDCRGTPFSQKVHLAGCETKYVLNRYCQGTCPSFYIPDLQSRQRMQGFAWRSAQHCVPVDTELVEVRLECDNGKSLIRAVQRIKKCGCRNMKSPFEEYDFLFR